MLFIVKPLSFPTSLLTGLLKTVILCTTTLIDVVNVINSRYSPIICKLAFSDYIRKGSVQNLDSTFLEATQEQGKLTNMHHNLEPNRYHSRLELQEKNLWNMDSSCKEFF